MIPANTNKAQTIFRNGKTNFRQNWSSRTLQHSNLKRPHSDSDTLLRFAASPDVTGHNLNRTETRPRAASRPGWPGWGTAASRLPPQAILRSGAQIQTEDPPRYLPGSSPRPPLSFRTRPPPRENPAGASKMLHPLTQETDVRRLSGRLQRCYFNGQLF